jgi:hypothetical protein
VFVFQANHLGERQPMPWVREVAVPDSARIPTRYTNS